MSRQIRSEQPLESSLMISMQSQPVENAQSVVDNDLAFICDSLGSKFLHLSGKRFLITGGAGFLGHYLVQSLLYWNHHFGSEGTIHVTVLDNFIRGIPDWLDKLSANTGLRLIKHDITQALPMDAGDFEYIIHAASIASPIYYRKYPIETMDANVNGLRLLLDYCLQRGQKNRPVEGFLYFSTSEIYGDPDPANIPTSEDYRGNVSCTGPRACYDESKRYGETLCVNFARQYGIPVKVVRPFNNYGPGLKISDRRVIPDFARDILNNRDIVMHSDGAPTRTFCYVADAIIGYFRVLFDGRPGEAYNIGNETPEISMNDLAFKITEISRGLFGYKGRVIHQVSSDREYLIDNPNRRCPIIAKAKNELGYEPVVSLDEGLRRSLIWYGDNTITVDA